MRLDARVGLGLLVFLAAPVLAGDSFSRAAKLRGVEFPEAVLNSRLKHKKIGRPSENATQTCLIFARYAVLFADEGQMGVDDLEVRLRPEGMKELDACAVPFGGRSSRPTGEAARYEPKGIFGRVLFATWVDSFGEMTGFALFDLETGRTVYEDGYVEDRGITFENGSHRPVLTYWSQLTEFDCIPRRGESACWNRIREKNAIPATVPQPDCEEAVAGDPSILQGEANRTVQITVHVRVPRLSRRDAVYLPDRPGCAATP